MRLRRRRFPTPAEIRADQVAAVERVEAQLAAGRDLVEVEGRLIHREAAWAATQALRKAWEVGGHYDGQESPGGGEWVARVTVGGELVLHSLGRFPG